MGAGAYSASDSVILPNPSFTCKYLIMFPLKPNLLKQWLDTEIDKNSSYMLEGQRNIFELDTESPIDAPNPGIS